MKNVLFTTTALVAFAGAAAAEVSFSGSVEVGYYDDLDGSTLTDGFYSESDITFAMDFDNGVSVAVSLGVDLNADLELDVFPTVVVSTEWITVSYGEVEYAGTDLFSPLSGMSFGDYADEEAIREQNGESVLRADVTFGGFTLGVSTDPGAERYPADNVSVGVSGKFGAFTVSGMYDNAVDFDEDLDDDTIYAGYSAIVYGIGVSVNFGGFDVAVAYISEDLYIDSESLGVEVGTTFGSVDVSAYYASNSRSDDEYGASATATFGAATVGVYYEADNGDWFGGSGNGVADSNIGATIDYSVTDSITVSAGYEQEESFFLAAVMGISDGVEVGAAYSDAGNEYDTGISVWVSAKF